MTSPFPSLASWVEPKGLAVAAKELGVPSKTLWAWLNRGQVPVAEAAGVSKKTGIPLASLRPKDWKKIWPRAQAVRASAKVEA